MTRLSRFLAAAGLVAVAACDTTITAPDPGTPEVASRVPEPVAAAFTPGGVSLLTGSAEDAWPELDGDYVSWYRPVPAEEQGLWLMDLRSGDASRIWAGTILSSFDMVDGRIFWGTPDALLVHEIATGTTERLAGTYMNYRDVSAGPRYVVGTATQGSPRPFVYDRLNGTEELVLTPARVQATRGWEDWLLYSYALTNTVGDLYLYHIPTGVETPVTRQDQILTAAKADLSDGRVAYTARRWCPATVELYDMASTSTTVVSSPASCPSVMILEGDLLVYRENAGGGIINLGFQDLETGEAVSFALGDPGTRRIDADLDGTRVVHTSVDGLTLLDLRFQEVQPPVADAGGPYEVVEGTELRMDGSGSASPGGSSLAYLWTLPDGTTLEGVTPTWTWEDDGEFTVSLVVADPDGLTDRDEAAVAVRNAPPELTVGPMGARATAAPGALSGVAGEPVTLLAGFTDPGILDAPWSWSVTWDEGSLASGTAESQGALPPVTWTPARAGSYTVLVRVEDKDGGVAEARILLQVENPPLPALRVRAGTGARNNIPAPGSNGVFPVVAFGMPGAPADHFDLEAFRLGDREAAPLLDRGHAPVLEDRDGDGLLDAVLTFRSRDVGLDPDAREVCLSGVTRTGPGVTREGEELHGCSPIRIAGGGRR